MTYFIEQDDPGWSIKAQELFDLYWTNWRHWETVFLVNTLMSLPLTR